MPPTQKATNLIFFLHTIESFEEYLQPIDDLLEKSLIPTILGYNT